MRALGRSLTAVGALLCYFLLNSTVSWAADEVGRLIDVLGEARSFKVRVQAITVLARLRDSRIASALGRSALSDRHNYVRLYALRTLVKVTRDEPVNERTRSVLQRAQRDRRAEVRREAARLMAELTSGDSAGRGEARSATAPGPLVVAVGAISDQTGRARPQLRLQMRNALIGNLRSVRQLSVVSSLAIDARPTYVVDGSIARLTHGTVGHRRGDRLRRAAGDQPPTPGHRDGGLGRGRGAAPAQPVSSAHARCHGIRGAGARRRQRPRKCLPLSLRSLMLFTSSKDSHHA